MAPPDQTSAGSESCITPSKAFEKFHHLGCQIRVVVDDLPAIGFSAVDIGDPMLDGNVATSQSHLTSLDANFISHIPYAEDRKGVHDEPGPAPQVAGGELAGANVVQGCCDRYS